MTRFLLIGLMHKAAALDMSGAPDPDDEGL